MAETSDATRCSSPRPEDITVCYAVTHDGGWPRRAAASAYSAVRSNPGIRVRIAEVDGGDYPWGIWPAVLPGPDCGTPWVLMLDADTWVSGNLRRLFGAAFMSQDPDIYLRHSSAWTGGKIDAEKWQAILDHFKLPHVPVYSNGCILCRAQVSGVLRDELPVWTDAIRGCGLPDPLTRFKGKPEWWMRDQFALAAIVAKYRWDVCELTARQWSWNWKEEPPGIVHHIGSDVDPFEENAWPRYRQT